MPPKMTVPGSVKKAIRDQTIKGAIRPPDLARLVNYFFEAAGGERQVAQLLYQEFMNSPSGGVVRQRILDLILRSTRYVNDKTAPESDLGVLSDQDLERELNTLLDAAIAGGDHAAEEADDNEAGGHPGARSSAEAEEEWAPPPGGSGPAADAGRSPADPDPRSAGQPVL